VSGTFADAWAAIADVPGWLSEDQARRLFDCAAAVAPGGTIVEIGSFRGRSTIVLALAAGTDVEIIAIDPHAGTDRGPREIHGHEAEALEDRREFEANIARAGVAARVRHVPRRSSEALDEAPASIAMLYVDGAHRYRPARADLVRWGARVAPGGTMLIHDSFSSVGVTLAILRELAFGDRFRYEGRTRSLARYRRAVEPLRIGARRANCARQLTQLPWFARNLAIKLALVLKRPRCAVLLGHDARDRWPY
jgi:predicted O-methyltransferase YrrM